MDLGFEWDPGKAELNVRKHGVSFVEAMTAFDDPFGLTIEDMVHSLDERHFLHLGSTITGKIVVVVHLIRGDNVRIVSARAATPTERRTYEEA